MKKLVCVIVCIMVIFSAGATEKSSRIYKQSLRYMFLGQTLVAETVFPVLSLTFLNYMYARNVVGTASDMVKTAVIEAVMLIPIIAGVSVYMKGRSLFKKGNKEAENHLSKLMLYFTKLRMFRFFIGVTSSLTGIGTAMFIPGVISAAAWYGGNAPIAVAFVINFGVICLAVSLPLLISSLLMVAWIKSYNLRLSPVMDLSRDEEKIVPDDMLSGYSLKIGLKFSL